MKKGIYIIVALALALALYFVFINKNKNSKKVDVSGIDVSLDINRYDQSFFTLDSNDILGSLAELEAKDTVFFDFYTNQLMRFGRVADTISPVTKDINRFISNPYVLELHDTVQKHYGDLSDYKAELTQAFKHFKYYFPEKGLPAVYSMISEFSYNAVSLDTSLIAIGLDLYLGKEYKYYTSFDFPEYVINRFEEEYMVPNSMEVLYRAHFAEDAYLASQPLIHAMINKGKKLYFLECMQPTKPKHMLIGFTPNQYDWCANEEAQIWKFYNEKDVFYSKDYMDHKRHVEEGPLTPGMPAEAPGNVGSFVGWQIVNSYMEGAGKEGGLHALVETTPDVILARSKYKPK